MGIDTASKHVVLCYGQYSKDDNSLFFILELRDPANGEVVSIEQTCCLNTVITSSGRFTPLIYLLSRVVSTSFGAIQMVLMLSIFPLSHRLIQISGVGMERMEIIGF